MLSLEKVKFAGGEIYAVNQNGTVYVSVRKLCEELGVNTESQTAKLKKLAADGDDWATTVIIAGVAFDGVTRQMTCLQADSIPMWMLTISPSKVDESVREKLKQYKNEAKRVLADHFMPKATTSEDPVLRMLEANAQTLAAITQTRKDQLLLEQKVDKIEARVEEIKNFPTTALIFNHEESITSLRLSFDKFMRFAIAEKYPEDNGMIVVNINKALVRFNKVKRANWNFAHYDAAIRFLKSNYGLDISGCINNYGQQRLM
jgi:hypothetical protein